MKRILLIITAIIGTACLFAQTQNPTNGKEASKTKSTFNSAFDFSGATKGDILKFNGTQWVKFTPPSTTFGNCESCHNATNQKAKLTEYRLSKHFYGHTSSRNGKYCGNCHTNQGFQEVIDNQTHLLSEDMPNGTKITCKTCHSHTTYDMSGDTANLSLRTTAPVALAYNKYSKAKDFGKTTNLCINCHQIRGTTGPSETLPFFPFDSSKDPKADVQYKQGQSFSLHDGNQSNLLLGMNGYEYPGQTYNRTWVHSNLSCTKCHMNEYNAASETGGHTLKCNIDQCTECHKGVDKLTPVVVSISAKLKELGDLLVARKVFNRSYSPVYTHDYNGLLYDGTATTVYTTIAPNNTISPSTGLVVYGTQLVTAPDNAAVAATRIGRPLKWGELGAAYNYAYIKNESPSKTNYGVHNPVYALQLLQKSIDWLKAN